MYILGMSVFKHVSMNFVQILDLLTLIDYAADDFMRQA